MTDFTVVWSVDRGAPVTYNFGTSNPIGEVPVGNGAGTYSITVHKSGYADWMANRVTIAPFGCDPNRAAQSVIARLQQSR